MDGWTVCVQLLRFLCNGGVTDLHSNLHRNAARLAMIVYARSLNCKVSCWMKCEELCLGHDRAAEPPARLVASRSSTNVTISSSVSDCIPCWRAIRRTRQSTLSMCSAPPNSVRAAEEGLVRHSAALAYFSKGTISASSAPSPVQSVRTQS